MATRNEQVINKIIKKIEDVSKRPLTATEARKIAKSTRDQIRIRTRLGKGVKNGQIVALKRLSSSYIEQRRGRKRFFTDKSGRVRVIDNPKTQPFLSPKTRPAKSNATATAQLLDSMQFRGTIKRIEVFFNDFRFFDLWGQPAKIGNLEVLKFYERIRPFFALAKFEQNKMIREVRQIILKKLTQN